MDDSISRLSSISDSSGTLEEYDYLGLGTVVRRGHPESDLDLTYIKLASESVGDAGDQYNGLDRFGRVVDQRWLDSVSMADLDRFFYEHDRDSNRTARLNALKTGDLRSIEWHGQETAPQQGVRPRFPPHGQAQCAENRRPSVDRVARSGDRATTPAPPAGATTVWDTVPQQTEERIASRSPSASGLTDSSNGFVRVRSP